MEMTFQKISENFWLLGRAKFFGIAEWYVGLCV